MIMRSAAVLLLMAIAVAAADIQPAPWEKPASVGRDLFRENCAVCHDIDKDQKHTRKLGPSLNHLFQNERLPLSHAKPSRQYVDVRIKFGGPLMPAFRQQMTQAQIDTLMDYIAMK
jgi:mono/diheme cytochrome c family protein